MDALIRKMIFAHIRESSEGCPDENTTAAYLEGILSAGEKSAFENHVSECSACQKILAHSMKLQPHEAIGQATATPGTSKKMLFRFSIPIPVLGGVLVAIILAAVLFRVTNGGRQNPSKLQSAELHLPAQGTEAALGNESIQAPEANKSRFAFEKPGIDARTSENKPAEPAPAGSKAETKSYAPAIPPADKETDLSVVGSMQKKAGAGASAESEELAAQPFQGADQDQADKIQNMDQQLRPVSPKEALLGSSHRAKLQSVASRRIGDKEFYWDSGYWTDRQCAEHRETRIIEIESTSPEYKKILEQYPQLRDLRPALVYWSNRIYRLR